MAHTTDTIIALATPAGMSSVGVVRVSGPDAIRITDQLFTGKAPLAQTASHRVRHGQLMAYTAGPVLDDVVVALFLGPNSFTGEDVVEISCHGSPFILRKVLAALSEAGARYARAGEFTQRAFLNGRLDLVQAEAVIDLIEAQGERAHTAAIRQLRGETSNKIKSLREQLIDFASLIELELDFSEEDVEFAQRDDLEVLVRFMIQHIGELVDSFKTGNAIKQGIATVIAGRPNAGKSTLLNQLLGDDRAIVSEIPGTTREFIEDIMTLEGWPFRFIDTAGLRESDDKIEQMGVERTRQRMARADMVIYLFDARHANAWTLEMELKELALPEGTPLLVVANKIDVLHPQQELPKIPEKYGEITPISAEKGQNIEELKQRLLALVEQRHASASDVVITSHRHYECLIKAREALNGVLEGMALSLPGDLLAQDIRMALFHLGEITGEISSEDLLGNIFGRFCIGK